MRVNRCGGMTEFIPSPVEKRDDIIHNHVLDLLVNLDARLRRIENAAGLPTDMADEFSDTMLKITSEEEYIRKLNAELLKDSNY